MQCCPARLEGRFRQAAQLPLEARLLAVSREDVTRETHSWKLFCLLPYWLFRRPQSKGRVGKAELSKMFDQFENGQWATLHEEAERCVLTSRRPKPLCSLFGKEKCPLPRQCRSSRRPKPLQQRVREGEVSRARQCT